MVGVRVRDLRDKTRGWEKKGDRGDSVDEKERRPRCEGGFLPPGLVRPQLDPGGTVLG